MPWVRTGCEDNLGERDLVATVYLILRCDDGLSRISLLFSRTRRTVSISIVVIGALRCIDEGDDVAFGFTNGARLVIPQDGVTNCSGMARLRFGSTVGDHGSFWGQRENLRTLAESDVEAVEIWGQGLSIRAELTEDESRFLRETARCIGGTRAGPDSSPVWDYAPDDFLLGVDKMASVISRVDPTYPEGALEDGIEGVVLVKVVVGVDGLTSSAEVIQSVAGLDSAALDAVARWRFSPGMIHGSPVPTQMVVPIRFRLPRRHS